jgi:hypothetical protein
MADQPNDHAEISVAIEGSDDGDQYLPVMSGWPIDLEVRGAEWRFGCLWHEHPGVLFQRGNLKSMRMIRATAFEPPDGLTVTLTVADRPALRFRCVSLDRALNPPMPPQPVDFSFPG